MLGLRQFYRHVPRWTQTRSVSTLDGHPHIYAFPSNGSHVLSLLPSEPTNPDLSIGLTSKLPPTPESFRENPKFLGILQEVVSKYAHEDPDAISQAQVMASTSGANLAAGGVLLTGSHPRRRRGEVDSSGASGQGGAGSAGRGGWIHISDGRRPPEYGRIAWPEDIFGSLEVEGDGSFAGGNGNYQPSGTYRILTRDGILGLSPFLREKLVQKLQEQETK
ncbi:hypothetical protein P175DRAFT_0370861 [Aspergillus ochraceoroseus IBT 24754]|uniref:Uncharacterized protein n=3 Tax=Aspergillus subgen. Nidulantes TaxID=2720870 RepID=A0A0F8V9T6_9EURO|nr:uncharacterized protein P175DRAFT_0370861 [Aspergillus ochraceoroseus IBT 24754]KKK16590.1 hypothetical protein AOCH_005098 [Aspergillus ochraceoroseus]KKK19781.1 hypothetical protein ARAM_006530 [Aspergillus rambellii]PTU18451.1 hypothetical protein P175DRAFT_0370861 [Aspergillus ochraceoroseus IBT 24754]